MIGTREIDMPTTAARTMTLITRLTVALTAALLLTPAAARAQSEEVVYYHTDAIGSVRAITDATGAVIERYDFLPFGEALPSTVPETRQFAGKERDAETGLDYFGARHHMSATGRLTTVDPVMNVEAALTDPQRWNRYAYALNSPFKFTDPDGRDPRLVGALIGTAVYSGWNAYVNVQQGRPWYENASREAAKGLVVGLSLGLAGPALASASVAELGTSAGAATAATTTGPNANKLHHIFGKAEHGLDSFVKAQGGREKAFEAIQDAANKALAEGKLVPGPNGFFPNGNRGPIIDVAGTQIRLVGGRVIDGVVEIATASRKGLQ